MSATRPPLLTLLLFAACAQAEANVSPPAVPGEVPQPVRTAAVEWGGLPPIHAMGTLAGKEEVKLAFKNGGTVASLKVEAGAEVKRGQVLATLERTEIDNQVAEAQASADKAQRDYDRALQLRASGTMAQNGLDNAQTGLAVAKAQLAIARYNAKVAVVTAPEDGTIERRYVEVEELVNPGQAIYALRTRQRGLVLRVGLTDRQVADVALGSQAEVHFAAAPGRSFAGVISELASSATAKTGTFEAELRLSGTGVEGLRPGLVGTVELARPQARLPWIPVEALVEQSGLGASVYALDGQAVARKHPVEIAYLQGSRAAIAAGLEGVEAVVIDGANALAPGKATALAP